MPMEEQRGGGEVAVRLIYGLIITADSISPAEELHVACGTCVLVGLRGDFSAQNV